MSVIAEDKQPIRRRTEVHLCKSNLFRTVCTDGAIGNTADDIIAMAFFRDRVAIPEKMVFETAADGSPVEVFEERLGVRGLEREVEVEIVMNLNVARVVCTWLAERIEALQSQRHRTYGNAFEQASSREEKVQK